jgi:hypothetical protein
VCVYTCVCVYVCVCVCEEKITNRSDHSVLPPPSVLFHCTTLHYTSLRIHIHTLGRASSAAGTWLHCGFCCAPGTYGRRMTGQWGRALCLVRVCMYIYICVCIHIYVYVCVYVYVYVCVCIYKCVCVCMFIYMCMCVCMYMCMCMCVYVYIHMHM